MRKSSERKVRPGRKNHISRILFLILTAFLLTGCEAGRDLLGFLNGETGLSGDGQEEGRGTFEEDVRSKEDLDESGRDGNSGEEGEESPAAERAEDLTGGFSYAYNSLSVPEQTLYGELLSGIESMEDSIAMSSKNQEQINTAFSALMLDHPELYYIDAGCDLYFEKLRERILKIEFRPRYTMDAAKREEAAEKIDAYVQDCLSAIGENASDYEKVKGVYEYLIQNTDYVLDSPDNQNICSIFLNGKTVCQGYAKGMQYILNRAGIFCTLVEGYVRDKEHHAWNLVRVDGEYYYADATWGDVSYTLSEGGSPLRELPEISYDYLCVNDEMLLKTHIIDSMVPIPPCNSLKANYYVREGVYFTQVDTDQIKSAFQKAYGEGRQSLTLKCADAKVYREMQDYLVRDGHIFDYLGGSGGAEFLRTDETCILIFYLV